jgi:hypothetical protein
MLGYSLCSMRRGDMILSTVAWQDAPMPGPLVTSRRNFYGMYSSIVKASFPGGVALTTREFHR